MSEINADTRSMTKKLTVSGFLIALFMVVALSFKGFVIIPGITEIRPVNALPAIYGLIFGPTGALACAIGNLLADILGGTFSPASAAGMLGNYAMAYVPYKVWGGWLRKPDRDILWMEEAFDYIRYLFLAFLGAITAAVIIPPVADFLGFTSFGILFIIIFLNNFIVSATIGLVLYAVLSKAFQKGQLAQTRKVVFTLEPVQGKEVRGKLLAIITFITFVAASLFVLIFGNAPGQMLILIPMVILDILLVAMMWA